MGHMKNFDIRIRNGGDDAIAAVSELMAGRWIPVEERLPDVDEHVLACWVPRKDGMACAVIRTLNGKNVWTPGDQWTQCDPPTHWQPLPEPPEVK